MASHRRHRSKKIVRQVLRSLAWLYRNAQRYDIDRERIYVAATQRWPSDGDDDAALWPALAPDLPADLVKGGLAVSGLFDLEPLVHAPFVNVDLQLDLGRARRLSPALMPAATDAPLYLAVARWSRSEFSASPIYWPSAGARISPHGCRRRAPIT